MSLDERLKSVAQAYLSMHEKKMDPVDKDELKGKHADRDDKDIDNDGDVDDSDEYLHKKRQAISKSQKEGKRGFIAAAKAAKEKGEKTFVFAGKKYNCEEVLAKEAVEVEVEKDSEASPEMKKKPVAKGKPAAKKKDDKEEKGEAEVQAEGKYVGGPSHTHPQHIGGNNSPEAKKIKTALTKAGHSFKDHGDLPANKKANKHYISMKDKQGHAALMKLKKTHMNEGVDTSPAGNSPAAKAMAARDAEALDQAKKDTKADKRRDEDKQDGTNAVKEAPKRHNDSKVGEKELKKFKDMR